MKQYKKYVIPYKSAFILGPIFMIVEVLGEIILPKLMSMIINYGCGQDVTVAAKGPAYIIGIGAAMIGTALLMMMGGVLGAYFAVKASVNFAGDLRRDVFAKVQKFSFANIEKFSTGSLVTRLTNDITNIQNVLSMGLRMLLRAPGMLIGGLIMAFLMNAKLALVFCVVIPVLIISLAFVMKTAFPRFDVMQTKIDGLNSRIQENITNQRVVKSFVRDDFEKETFDRANNELKDKTLRAMKVVILTMPIMTLAMNLTVMAVVWFGGQQILIGDMPVGNLTAFTTYVTQILMSLMMVSMIMIQGSRAMASSHRILEVLDTDIDLNDDNASEKDRLVTSGEIEFKNVCFRYYKKHKKNVLQNINFTAKPGEVVGIIGSTGSGKSSLVNEILYKTLAKKLNHARTIPGRHTRIEGLEQVDKVIDIDQSPIGRTPRSNPATYTGVFDLIRDLFASTTDAKERGYNKGRFSFNVKGGRCEACSGDGIIKIEMHFLPDVYVPCEVCNGKRYNRETLEVKYKGKNIDDVLKMTVEEGLKFFENIPRIKNKLQTLYDVGLGYIRLGQPSTQLSGGEAQRIKLAYELSKRSTGKTLYILDEPSTGLHIDDVKRLIEILQRLVDAGNSVVVIEHNLDIIKCADHIIDLGPEGGDKGGTLVAEGTPEEIIKVENSYTGKYLRNML